MYSVCCKSWADGTEVETKEEVLKFIEESSIYKSDAKWFDKHFDEIKESGYLEHGDIEVEDLNNFEGTGMSERDINNLSEDEINDLIG